MTRRARLAVMITKSGNLMVIFRPCRAAITAIPACRANPSKQRNDEVLIDVEDVALGHTTKLRWNEAGKWLWSDKVVQPPIIDRETFDQAQAMIAGRAHTPAAHKPHRSRHPYALRGCVWCGVCERRMQSHWAYDVPYYRCRFPAEYALANRVQHPVNVYLREDQLTAR